MVFTFLPDRGHDPGGQSGSSCCWGTFGLTRYQGVGHSEQNHGQRSFHCTPCPASPTPVVNIVRNNIETKHSWQFSELLLMKQLALSRRRRIFIIIIIISSSSINQSTIFCGFMRSQVRPSVAFLVTVQSALRFQWMWFNTHEQREVPLPRWRWCRVSSCSPCRWPGPLQWIPWSESYWLTGSSE